MLAGLSNVTPYLLAIHPLGIRKYWEVFVSSHTISLPACWIDADHFERSFSPLDDECTHLTIVFPQKCSVMVDASLRMLSLVNQFSLANKSVDLCFCEYESGAMGYLNRIGFFDLLHAEGKIKVFPSKPDYSAAKIYAGNNSGTVEMTLPPKSMPLKS